MNRDELDTLWFQAMRQSIEEGEDFIRYHFAALVAAHEREKVARWIIYKGYATGHGDTIEDLLTELEWQVAELEREACAKVAESYEPRCEVCPSGVSNAIRARGEENKS